MLRRSLFSQFFCKGTKNIIDKQIILSIFASIISIIKEVYDPTATEIHRGHRPPTHAQHHYRNAPPIYA